MSKTTSYLPGEGLVHPIVVAMFPEASVVTCVVVPGIADGICLPSVHDVSSLTMYTGYVVEVAPFFLRFPFR